MDQGSTRKRSAVHNFAPTVTKFCVMWEGLSLPHDTKFGNSRCEIVGRRVIFIWSLIHGLRWSGLIKVGPGQLAVAVLSWIQWGGFASCGWPWKVIFWWWKLYPYPGWGLLSYLGCRYASHQRCSLCRGSQQGYTRSAQTSYCNLRVLWQLSNL